MTETDRIEKSIHIRAPRSRVWRALTDAAEFGSWFGVNLARDFQPGAQVTGKITHPGYEKAPFALVVERMEAEQVFSFRWHPHAVDPDFDYSGEAMTLVEFRLQDSAEGTLLTVVESGFDQIPAERRGEAFHRNSEGWGIQVERVRGHVEG